MKLHLDIVISLITHFYSNLIQNCMFYVFIYVIVFRYHNYLSERSRVFITHGGRQEMMLFRVTCCHSHFYGRSYCLFVINSCSYVCSTGIFFYPDCSDWHISLFLR